MCKACFLITLSSFGARMPRGDDEAITSERSERTKIEDFKMKSALDRLSIRYFLVLVLLQWFRVYSDWSLDRRRLRFCCLSAVLVRQFTMLEYSLGCADYIFLLSHKLPPDQIVPKMKECNVCISYCGVAPLALTMTSFATNVFTHKKFACKSFTRSYSLFAFRSPAFQFH